MKKAYTLFITIFLITVFSILSIQILEKKALRSENLTNQVLYIQAKNHLEFLKEYLKDEISSGKSSLDEGVETFELSKTIEIIDEKFTLKAVKSEDDKYYNLYIKAKDYDISLYEKLEIK
jgi:hypothetical protein